MQSKAFTITISYMLEKDEDLRAHSYMVWKIKRDLKFYKQFINDYPNSKNLKSRLKKDHLGMNLDDYFDRPKIQKLIDTKINLLKEPKFKRAKIEYERTKKISRNKDHNWYSLYDGPKNMEDLANYFKRVMEYELIYRIYSKNVHSTDIIKGLVYIGNNQARIIQIRDFRDAKDVIAIL